MLAFDMELYTLAVSYCKVLLILLILREFFFLFFFFIFFPSLKTSNNNLELFYIASAANSIFKKNLIAIKKKNMPTIMVFS